MWTEDLEILMKIKFSHGYKNGVQGEHVITKIAHSPQLEQNLA